MLCLPTQLKYGDKTSVEYSWTGSLPENILHFFSQLIRPVELVDLERHLSNILNMIQQAPQQYKAELIILYQLIGYTRDIHTGLGEGLTLIYADFGMAFLLPQIGNFRPYTICSRKKIWFLERYQKNM